MGYEGLSIDIFLTPRFQAMILPAYNAKQDVQDATDLLNAFESAFPAGFFQTKEDFDAALAAEAPLSIQEGELGEVVASEATEEGGRFVVTHANLSQSSDALKASKHAC